MKNLPETAPVPSIQRRRCRGIDLCRGFGPLRSLALVALLVGASGARVPPASADVLNRIVLRINDRIATLQDYELRRSQLVGELLQQGLPPAEQRKQMDQLGERVFSDMYEELMLLSRADQLDIRMTDEQLDSVLDQMQEQMKLPDRNALQAAVEQSGLEFGEFKEQWRNQLRMREVITREVEMPIQDELKEEELRRYYRNHPDEFRVSAQYKLREVVVLDDSDLSAAERRGLALAIREELRAGKTLDEVVPSHAQAGVTSKVIDLGWVGKAELSPELAEAVEGLEPGSVTEPVAARGGLHVVVVEDFKGSSLQSFDQVSDQILRIERRKLRDEKLPAYMQQLEDVSYILLDPPADAAGFKQFRSSLAQDLPELPEDEKAEKGPETETPPPATGDDPFKEVTVKVPVGPSPAEGKDSPPAPPDEPPPPR